MLDKVKKAKEKKNIEWAIFEPLVRSKAATAVAMALRPTRT